MRSFSRRKFLNLATLSGGILPFSVLLSRSNVSHAQAINTRHDVSSPMGKTMVEKYARAVGLMQQAPEGSPLSWTFQWYTHAVRRDKSKEVEIARIYPADSAERELALAMWNTCQAHGRSGVPEDSRMFLPWHRMYVSYFEQLIRKILNDNTFTLPYWDYTDASKRAIPEEFRMPSDPVFKALFREDRNPGVNDGEAIDGGAVDSPLNTDSLSQKKYESNGAELGFNRHLDRNLHGAVHVFVGNVVNMGDVPWAARDPIFWLHHCNIDRFWASWNGPTRLNPAGDWLTQAFTFADQEGHGVTPQVKEFVDTANVPNNGYVYDKLLPIPPVTVAAAAPVTIPSVVATQAQPGAIQLPENRSAEVRLVLAIPPVGGSNVLASPNRRLFLVLRDLKASSQPGVIYNVYVDGPSGKATSPVGTVNFFDAVGQMDHMENHSSENMFSFDVTDEVKSVGNDGTVASIRIEAVGSAASGSSPLIGAIDLVRQ